VVLLDEVEKAHPDVFNMLLQIMEEGRLTDSFGRNVDFRNTVMIMTSNLGADMIKGGAGFGFQKRTEAGDYDNIKVVLLKEIERFFRPEFINRLDDVIVFKPLTKADITSIIDYEVAKVSKRLKTQKIEIVIDELAKEFLIDRGYNPEFGARPLRRAIGQYVEDPLSEMLLQGDFTPPCRITITHKKPAEGDAAGGAKVEADDHLYFNTEQLPVVPPEPDSRAPRNDKHDKATAQST
jgi:ATP-dependent Clp protease ATP-binding subunit ClpC